MTQRNRISIEISDLQHELETCRDDMAWSELPMAAKIRVLIKERLRDMQSEGAPRQKGKKQPV